MGYNPEVLANFEYYTMEVGFTNFVMSHDEGISSFRVV